MMKNLKIFIVSLFFCFFLFNFVCGQSLIDIPNPLGSPTIIDFVEKLINFLFTLTLVCLPGVIVIAGILFITSGGEPEKIQRAKNLIVYSFVGFVVIVLSWAFVNFLRDYFLNSGSTSPPSTPPSSSPPPPPPPTSPPSFPPPYDV